MTVRLAAVLTFACSLAAGCGSDPGKKGEPVAVAGAVQTADGKPVGNVTLNFFPASGGDQMTAVAQLKADGKFDLKLVPGKYNLMFEGKDADLKAVPASYRTVDAAHFVEIPKAGEANLVIKLQ